MNKLLKKVGMAAAFVIIVAAVFSSVFRTLTPWAKQYKTDVEQHLSTLMGQPVKVASMETGWYWFQPVLKLQNISISDGTQQSIHLKKLLVGINLFKSLWHWHLEPGVLYIDDIHLVLRQNHGSWHIDGISAQATKESELTPKKTNQILVWLLQQERLIIRHVSAHVYPNKGKFLSLDGLNFSVVNSGGYYKLKGDAHLGDSNSTSFQLLGVLHFDLSHTEQTKGQLYFSAKEIAPAQWQSILPKISEKIEGGIGDLALWVDLNQGLVSSIQAQITSKNLAWRLPDKKSSQLIQDFSANMVWKPNQQGWQFLADHIQLKAAGVVWPENQLSIQMNQAEQSYKVFVKTILIESLLSKAVNWPVSLQDIIALKPHGILSDTHLLLKEKQLNSLLTRFYNIAWHGHASKNIPEVKNLTGVLHWQSDEGRLELDSENTAITFSGYPTQVAHILNAAIDWKELSDGLRVSLDRLVYSQPELTISAQGAIDQVRPQGLGSMRLEADFSAKNAQQWAALLPKKYVKPRLYEWLNHDLKRITQATGKIRLNGLAKDFPFDNSQGEFSISSHMSGTDLQINSNWPLISELEGYIRFNKRNLDIDIINGDFQGVPVQQMNLRIDDIGKDKETLLLHGLITAQAQKMMDFVLISPLREKLAKLKMLLLQGIMSLNLRLEIPLYPESAENLVAGEVTLKDNGLLIQHHLGQLRVEELTGDLFFNEHGITQSTLTASSLGYPMNINIHRDMQQASTDIEVSGELVIESLKNHFNLPLFSLFKGGFLYQTILRLTDDPKGFDTVNFKSNLQGLSIDVPAPLGKKHGTLMPFEAHLGYISKDKLRLKANYNKLLSTDLLFMESNGVFELGSGQLRLGSIQANNQGTPGFAIVGNLEGFDLEQWKKFLMQMPAGQTPFLLKKLRMIDVVLGQLTLLKQQFNHMAIKATRLPNQDWSFNLEQKKIAGDISYHAATNELSGYIHRLHLDQIQDTNFAGNKTLKIHPLQIPNLNLRIDNFSIHSMQIGNMTLKTQSFSDRWSVNYCHIDSPVYQVNVAGEWIQTGNNNQTKMQAKLHLQDLAKSLERWQMTPAVDAGKGDVEFNGSWQGAPHEFSLASLQGALYLKLKNGRITHLSPETEEKLGLGKLLSILSLQTIPRRLQLDFSDLSQQGYSFDIFQGNFDIKKGIMNTQNSYLDGPVAYASMKGDLDLVKRLYDLDLIISPHITASLPIVATIAGGPIVGIAAWVANKIINQSMQKISAYTYKISGPWNQPVLQQLTIVKKNVQR